MYNEANLKTLPKLGALAAPAWEAFVKFDQAALADGDTPKGIGN